MQAAFPVPVVPDHFSTSLDCSTSWKYKMQTHFLAQFQWARATQRNAALAYVQGGAIQSFATLACDCDRQLDRVPEVPSELPLHQRVNDRECPSQKHRPQGALYDKMGVLPKV